MKPVVIDASMAAAWSLEDEKNEAVERIFDEVKERLLKRFVPTIFWHETRSIFLKNERRGKITSEESLSLLADLRDLEPILRDTGDDAQVMALARKYGLSTYDAAYLSVALELGAILATNDRKLARAARAFRCRVAHDFRAGRGRVTLLSGA